MNAQRFRDALASRLKDPAQEIWSNGDLDAAMWAAVRAYSRYFPLKRRLGSGVLCGATSAGDVFIDVCGGPFAQGAPIQIDPAFSLETRTIAAAPPSPVVDGMGAAVRLVLTQPLAQPHPAGMMVVGPPGIAISAGQSAVYLPIDFLSFDQASFDLAVGVRAQVQREPGYYDGYGRWRDNSGVGPGLSQGFSSGYRTFYPGGPQPGATPPTQRLYEIVQGSPPMLLARPAFDAAFTLDCFYRACHVPETIPDADMEALVAYACYAAIAGEATGVIGNGGDFKEDDVEESGAKNSAAYRSLGELSLANWERWIVKRPYVVTG